MEKELIGFIDSSLIEDGNEEADEDIIEMIEEIEAEEAARLELADHAMNNEV